MLGSDRRLSSPIGIEARGRVSEAHQEHVEAVVARLGDDEPRANLLANHAGVLERATRRRSRPHDGVAPQLRAKARFALARGLAAADREPARARALAERAREAYLAAQGEFAERLAEIDAWLHTR